MKVAVRAYELACAFWTAVGGEEGFPRTLEDAAESAYPVTVKRLPGLTTGVLRAWLGQFGIELDTGPERRLCGCLAARRGQAIVFVDADDPPDEQRYTVAHELAHFLRDVLRPRQRVERVLGIPGLAVHDGARIASPDERLAAALDGIELTPHVHLLERGVDGRPATGVIAAAEAAADELAFELVAPAAHLAGRALSWSHAELIERLIGDYGLPPREAARYAEQLRPAPGMAAPWLQALRAAL